MAVASRCWLGLDWRWACVSLWAFRGYNLSNWKFLRTAWKRSERSLFDSFHILGRVFLLLLSLLYSFLPCQQAPTSNNMCSMIRAFNCADVAFTFISIKRCCFFSLFSLGLVGIRTEFMLKYSRTRFPAQTTCPNERTHVCDSSLCVGSQSHGGWTTNQRKRERSNTEKKETPNRIGNAGIVEFIAKRICFYRFVAPLAKCTAMVCSVNGKGEHTHTHT